jgi:anti-anti-sigma factor
MQARAMTVADLDVNVQGPILIAHLKGEIDLSNAGGVRSSLLREMRNDLLGLALDLSEVTYLDSAGIRVIYELRDDLQMRGQQMRLVVPDGSPVSTALELVDAFKVVGIVPDRETAVAELSAK